VRLLQVISVIEMLKDIQLSQLDRRGKVLLGAFLIFLAGYRLLLSESGQLYWPDEFRYLHVMHLIDSLSKGEIVDGLLWVFERENQAGSRPAYSFLATIPVFIQGLAYLFTGLEPKDPVFYRIPAIVNVVISLGVAVLFYRIIFLILEEQSLALVGVFVYGLLANTNMYVRHLFPYDVALLLLMASLLVLLKHQVCSEQWRSQIMVAGFLAGVGATAYPGYYPFVLILLAALAVNHAGSWRPIPVFLASTIAVFILWEVIARLAGSSFIGASRGWLATPQHGSFNEGYRFFPLYLLDVEGVAGMALLALFAYFWVVAIKGGYGRTEIAIVAMATVGYLAYASIVVMFRHVVVYGRLLHMYLPFLVLAAMLVIKSLKVGWARQAVVSALLLASVVSFVPMAANAITIRFPRDIERGLASSFPGARICKMMPTEADNFGDASTECDLIIENVRHLYPLPPVFESQAPTGFVLTGVHKHPLQFVPYWFEGYDPNERTRLRSHPLVMRVYARTGLVPSKGLETE